MIYVKERLKSSLREFYSWYRVLSNSMKPLPSPECYMTFWSMTICSDTYYWSDITLARDLLPNWTILPNLTSFYRIARCLHRTFATGAVCKQKALTPRETWPCPTLGLAFVLMLRPLCLKLVSLTDFWISNTPRYFYFTSFCIMTFHWNYCCCLELFVWWHFMGIDTVVSFCIKYWCCFHF